MKRRRILLVAFIICWVVGIIHFSSSLFEEDSPFRLGSSGGSEGGRSRQAIDRGPLKVFPESVAAKNARKVRVHNYKIYTQLVSSCSISKQHKSVYIAVVLVCLCQYELGSQVVVSSLSVPSHPSS